MMIPSTTSRFIDHFFVDWTIWTGHGGSVVRYSVDSRHDDQYLFHLPWRRAPGVLRLNGRDCGMLGLFLMPGVCGRNRILSDNSVYSSLRRLIRIRRSAARFPAAGEGRFCSAFETITIPTGAFDGGHLLPVSTCLITFPILDICIFWSIIPRTWI